MNLPTEKQINFLTTLAASRDLSKAPWNTSVVEAAKKGKASSFQVSKAIDEMKGLPWLPKTGQGPQTPLVPVGFYQLDGIIYKVRSSKADPTHRYAMAFQVSGAGKGTYSYEAGKGKIAKLTLAHKLTLEQAAAMGHQTGCCVICGRELTDPGSIALGVGPVCAEKCGF
jgi:hypothetical protein